MGRGQGTFAWCLPGAEGDRFCPEGVSGQIEQHGRLNRCNQQCEHGHMCI